MLTSFKRIIIFGWKNFKRNPGSSSAAVFILVIVISMITGLYLLQRPVEYLVDTIEEKVDVSLYFKEDSTESEMLTLTEEVEKMPEVEDVTYVSKDDALSVFKERHEQDHLLMESLEELGINPFLASLSIKAINPEKYKDIIEFVEASEYNSLVEKVDYYKKEPILERLFSINDKVNRFGIGFSVILGIVAFLVAFNQIQISLKNAKEEISTMRLVGASNWFIKGPFIVQGVAIGTAAALISLFLFFGGLSIFNSQIEASIPGLDMLGFFSDHFLLILLIQLATGIGVGVSASLIAIRKYLKA